MIYGIIANFLRYDNDIVCVCVCVCACVCVNSFWEGKARKPL